jgi:thioredoxin-dependent peroxiredoxin
MRSYRAPAVNRVERAKTMSEPVSNQLKVGNLAPDFTLPDEHGDLMRLSDLRGRRVVVYFYPMDDTPGCTLQACSFRDAYPQITERNAVVLGISADSEASHQAFQTKYNLPFTLLVDADHAVTHLYGAWNAEKNRLQRSQFVVDENGRLVDVRVPVKADESAGLALDALVRERA